MVTILKGRERKRKKKARKKDRRQYEKFKKKIKKCIILGNGRIVNRKELNTVLEIFYAAQVSSKFPAKFLMKIFQFLRQ